MSDGEHEFEMEMPFVTVASKGGPHDDNAFVAGYEMGTLDRELLAAPRQHQVTIRTDNTAQADLIAMRNGYVCEAEQSSEWPEWTFVTFRPMKPVEAE